MEAELVINGVDFAPWVKENGLQQSELVRLDRSVVTLDGVEHRGGVYKRGLSVALVELRDETWYRLRDALGERPAAVRYIDDALGPVEKRFYVSSPTAAARTVRGGHTYFSGGAFTLEEK